MKRTFLEGAVNDAKALKEVLVTHAGFPENQIILLTSDATDPDNRPRRENILGALNDLSTKVTTDIIGFVCVKSIIDTVEVWGSNPHALAKFFSQARTEIGCCSRKTKKVWCHIRVTRKSSISTKSNLRTDRKCHFVSIFQKYVKDPVKQKGLLFPPSAPSPLFSISYSPYVHCVLYVHSFQCLMVFIDAACRNRMAPAYCDSFLSSEFPQVSMTER